MKRIETSPPNRAIAQDSQCTSAHLDVLKKSLATQHQLNLLQSQLAQQAARPVAEQSQTGPAAQVSAKATKAS